MSINWSSLKRRTPLRRKTPLRKKSNSLESRLIRECDDLLLKILLKLRGHKCEICGRTRGTGRLGKFHILPKGAYPRLRYYEQNVLIVGWTCCHNNWHSDYYKGREIEKRLKELRGEDYERQLKIADISATPLNTFMLELYRAAFKIKLGEKS